MKRAIFSVQPCLAIIAFGAASVLLPEAAVAQSARDTVLPAQSDGNPGAAVGVGGDFAGGSYSGYLAGTFAFNGDLYADGVLVRASGGAGEYKAGVTPFATSSNVSFYSAGLMLGYQKKVGDAVVTGFVGPEIVHNGRNADPRVRGSEWAGRVIGEIYVPTDNVDYGLWSSYTTFENQYFVSGRALFHEEPGSGSMGPEVSLFGGDGWQRGRVGLHAVIPASFGEVGVSSGYDFDLRGDVEESPFISIGLSFPL